MRPGDKLSLWLLAICQKEFLLEQGKEYHIQGIDGYKLILDHNSLVEPWPEKTSAECRAQLKETCIKKPCLKYKNKNDRHLCEKEREVKCKPKIKTQCNDFDRYVAHIKEGAICEIRDICEQMS